MKDSHYDFPKWVKFGFIAGVIKDMVIDEKLKMEDLPVGVQEFINTNPDSVAFEWADALMKRSVDMPIDELERWVNNLSGGHFYRAEMRALLKQRKNDLTTAGKSV